MFYIMYVNYNFSKIVTIYMLPIIDQSHNSSTELKYYSKFILLVSVTNNNNSREPATPIILSLII